MKIVFYCGSEILDVIENIPSIDEASADMISFGNNKIKNIACDYLIVDDHVDSSSITPELLELDRKGEFKPLVERVAALENIDRHFPKETDILTEETIRFLLEEIEELKNRIAALEAEAQ